MLKLDGVRRSNAAIQDIPIGEAGADDEDLLEVGPYVKALAQFASSCATPMTIAIQGDWGSGKTSLMNMVRKSLEMEHDHIETRWFNTWQFSQFKMDDDIATTMLSGFLYELDDDNQKVNSALKNVREMTMRGVSRVAKAVTDITTGGAGDLAKDVIDKLAQNQNDMARQLRDLKKQVFEAVDSVLKKMEADRLVVFIDDLDRIVPERAIELLETIKMFMDVPGVVFVLALDYAVVKRGLKKKFDTDENDLGGRSFFDKIIQLPFTMPTANYQISGYLKKLLQQVDFEFSDEDIEVYEDLIRYSIGFNPRSAKRLVNVMKIYRLVESGKANTSGAHQGQADAAGYRNRVLFGLVCLQTAYEPAFHYLRRNLTPLAMQEIKDGNLEGISEAYQDAGALAAFKQASKLIRLFLNGLFRAVDRNGNGELDDEEIQALRYVMKDLAITSVTDVQGGASETWDYFSLGKMTVASVLQYPDKRTLIDLIRWYANCTTQTAGKELRNAEAGARVEDSVKGYKDFGTAGGIGRCTVSLVRDEDLYSVVQSVMGKNVDIDSIKRALKDVKGNTLLKNAFKNSELKWPD